MEYKVISPRGERLTTTLPTYKHMVVARDDSDPTDTATASVSFCEVHIHAPMCEHGWVYEVSDKL
jgi:hypothetical protein